MVQKEKGGQERERKRETMFKEIIFARLQKHGAQFKLIATWNGSSEHRYKIIIEWNDTSVTVFTRCVSMCFFNRSYTIDSLYKLKSPKFISYSDLFELDIRLIINVRVLKPNAGQVYKTAQAQVWHDAM